jgi:hypothetical protein
MHSGRSTPTLSTVTQTAYSQRPDTVTSFLFFIPQRAFLLEDKAAVQDSGSATLSSRFRLSAILTGPHDVAAPESQDTDSAKRGWTFAVTDTPSPPSSHLIYYVARDFGRAQRSVDQIQGEQATTQRV